MNNKTIKVGLVLEGGATRGMYTAGVLDAFLTHNIHVDKIVGVSAGALFGVNYVSKQIGRAIRYNKRFNSDKNYMGIIPLLKEGNIISTKYAYEDVPLHLDPFDTKTYNESNIEFYAVITNVDKGISEYPKVDKLCEQMDTLRASGSMPVVSKPVLINGQRYLDGAVFDSIPYDWMMKQDVDKVIVVLTQDKTYRKKAMPKFLFDIYGLFYPKIAKGMKERHLMYNNQVEELHVLENKKEVFVIQPSKPIKMAKLERNPKVLQDVYDLGVQDTLNSLDNLREYLQNA